MSQVLGIDVGATLCKLARPGTSLAVEHHASAALAAVRERVVALRPRVLGLTGGGATELSNALDGARVEHVSEFQAWARGAPLVAAHEGLTLPGRYLLVSLGTGTSVLAVDGEDVMRVGGTALGGGTVLGLGRLLLRATDFQAIGDLAARGDRRKVDLLVSDVYRGTVPVVAADLTASSFAKLGSTRPEDLAHALMGLVGENVALIAGELARGAGVDTVVYCGSTLERNPALRAIVEEITIRFGHRPLFLARGAYCGAVGAAAVADAA